MIPDLVHNCNSWVVTRNSDGQIIGEFFNKRNVEKFDLNKVTVELTSEYLARINGY
jgi:hypothetical protein